MTKEEEQLKHLLKQARIMNDQTMQIEMLVEHLETIKVHAFCTQCVEACKIADEAIKRLEQMEESPTDCDDYLQIGNFD